MAPPGLDWYYNSRTGAVQILPKPQGEALLHLGIGWHGPFDTKQDALDYYTRNAPNNPGWKAPTGISGNLSNALDSAGDVAGGAVTTVTEPISDLTTGIAAAVNTAVKLVPRILEATLGIVLLAIAANVILRQATGVDVAGSAVRAGKKVAKTAAVV